MPRGILQDAYFLVQAVDVAMAGLAIRGFDYGSQTGCVLVGSDNSLIAWAHNDEKDGQRRHAEELVLEEVVGEDLSEATLYVTNEPCTNHPFQQRRPCCEQIAASGVGRVVVGRIKRKYQGGADHIAANGTTVDILGNRRLNYLCDLLTAPGFTAGQLSFANIQKLLDIRESLRL